MLRILIIARPARYRSKGRPRHRRRAAGLAGLRRSKRWQPSLGSSPRMSAPDIAVLGISLSGLCGVSLTRRLSRERPNVRVLLFTMQDDAETIRVSLAAGARGYVLKTDSVDHLAAAIAALSAGRPYFSPVASEALLHAALHERERSILENLTIREMEVAQLQGRRRQGQQADRDAPQSWPQDRGVASPRRRSTKKAGVAQPPASSASPSSTNSSRLSHRPRATPKASKPGPPKATFARFGRAISLRPAARGPCPGEPGPWGRSLRPRA